MSPGIDPIHEVEYKEDMSPIKFNNENQSLRIVPESSTMAVA